MICRDLENEKRLWLLSFHTVLASAMPSRNSSPAAKKASFKTPDDKPKPKSGLQRSGTKVASKGGAEVDGRDLGAGGGARGGGPVPGGGGAAGAWTRGGQVDVRRQTRAGEREAEEGDAAVAAAGGVLRARGKKPLFEFETPLLDGVIEEYFANGALERRWVAVREGADALREKATELAQPLTELIRPGETKVEGRRARRGGRAHPGRRGAAPLESAPQRMLMLSEPRILGYWGEVVGTVQEGERE